MESLRQKLNKIPKKGWVAIAISLAVVVICTVLKTKSGGARR